MYVVDQLTLRNVLLALHKPMTTRQLENLAYKFINSGICKSYAKGNWEPLARMYYGLSTKGSMFVKIVEQKLLEKESVL